MKQQIAGAAGEEDGTTEYARGLRALAGRDFRGAADALRRGRGDGLQGAHVRPLRVYALCAAQQVDAARELARGVKPHDPDEVHFWAWMGKEFGVGPVNSR